ncbi:F-box only protein 44 isoform X2 [Lontra canadensis]|uniref:F-box only protein 44 isoform X2 n=1 Tax=Lontra canadensis TaxID=76717 RepID=UPI0013F34C0C|nr:F-box only protein 44 isoform X2 [Lontra canadensis]
MIIIPCPQPLFHLRWRTCWMALPDCALLLTLHKYRLACWKRLALESEKTPFSVPVRVTLGRGASRSHPPWPWGTSTSCPRTFCWSCSRTCPPASCCCAVAWSAASGETSLTCLHRNLLHNPCAEEGFEFWSLDVNGGDEWKVEDLSRDQRKEFPNDQVRSQARLRVQVPAVCSAPVVSTRTSGDLPARPGNDPAEERCQVEGGLSHILQLPARRPLHLVSARRRGHSLLGRLVRPEGHQQQHHHRTSPALTPPKP